MITQTQLMLQIAKGSGVVELQHSWPFPTFKSQVCITPDTATTFDEKTEFRSTDATPHVNEYSLTDFPDALI